MGAKMGEGGTHLHPLNVTVGWCIVHVSRDCDSTSLCMSMSVKKQLVIVNAPRYDSSFILAPQSLMPCICGRHVHVEMRRRR